MLYIAALGARNSIFRASYKALVARGKPPKLAIVAVMRKLMVTLNAMLRTNSLFCTPISTSAT